MKLLSDCYGVRIDASTAFCHPNHATGHRMRLRRKPPRHATSNVELKWTCTHASPSSSESSCGLRRDGLAFEPRFAGAGDAERLLTEPSESESPPARAKSSSSISAIMSICQGSRILQKIACSQGSGFSSLFATLFVQQLPSSNERIGLSKSKCPVTGPLRDIA
jgi:hypothetical protein